MKLNKIIKSEYNSILKEAFEYNNVDFTKVNSIQSLYSLVNNNIIKSLYSISNMVLLLPQERRYDLSEIKNIIKFIESIKEDIDIASDISERYEEDENFDKLDHIILKADNIYDSLYTLFDSLDSMLLSIDDKFDSFEESIKRYLK